MGNIFSDVSELKNFAIINGFSGIDWSFDLETLPGTPAEESEWVRNLSLLAPLELRYHCPFYQTDLGHEDPNEAKAANALFRRIIRLVSKAEGKYLSIHIGLGRDSTVPLLWDETLENLAQLVQFAHGHRVKLCLENLAW